MGMVVAPDHWHRMICDCCGLYPQYIISVLPDYFLAVYSMYLVKAFVILWLLPHIGGAVKILCPP